MTRRSTFTELLDLAEGRLERDHAQRVADEIALDDEAALTFAWIEDFLHDARRMPLQEPPPELRARLRDLFAGHHTQQDDSWSDASLLHDTRKQAAGVRSAGVHDSVHLAFDSEGGRFVVEVRPAGTGAVDVVGLVLLNDGSAGTDLTFLEAGVVRRVARAERDGRFEATGVPETVDELRLTTGAVRVRTRLDLRQR
ncbi:MULTISPECIES: hypothetical protein [Nocardioides]|uniref:DUF1707 domain-containing protein n=1 Tax=Nocardioides vastitatis TaxID=2568655 RepID=A0ABW0ZCH4_9ACTN|nr:hypothetical protein [Nocardioides sp.]THI98862.1 hypothetical protein E7Z54_13085 [Nocardioides sp.]